MRHTSSTHDSAGPGRRRATAARGGGLGIVVLATLLLSACTPTGLWAWGQNGFGQLGIGSTTSATWPAAVDATWRQVSTGTHHVLAIREDGTLWAWGENA